MIIQMMSIAFCNFQVGVGAAFNATWDCMQSELFVLVSGFYVFVAVTAVRDIHLNCTFCTERHFT
jgi:hypothetical protein